MYAYFEGSLTSLVCALYIFYVNCVHFLFSPVVNFMVNIFEVSIPV